MKVRDHTEKVTEYKGHWTFAVDSSCPCRSCYNTHDCTPPNGEHSSKIYSDVFHCATNWNNGCPTPKPEPKHVLSPHGRVCKRCKQRIERER